MQQSSKSWAEEKTSPRGRAVELVGNALHCRMIFSFRSLEQQLLLENFY